MFDKKKKEADKTEPKVQKNSDAATEKEPDTEIRKTADPIIQEGKESAVEKADNEDATNAEVAQQHSKSSFVIKKRTSEKDAILQSVDISQLIEKYPALNSIKDLANLNSPLLVISECAEKGIKKHIAWGKITKTNMCEQGGILVGRPFLVGESVLGIVEYAIPAEIKRASSAYLEMGTETWTKMLDIYDEHYKENGLYIIGWFHTHPNDLPVFMSSTDMGTQRAFFNQDWHFSIVLNPHRHLIACFNSAKADKCKYYPSNFVDR